MQESWWETIPQRVNLKRARLEVINSQVNALRNREIRTSDLTTDSFVANYLVALYKSEMQRNLEFPKSLTFELEERSSIEPDGNEAAFNIVATTHLEMQRRVKRVHLNVGTLQGIQELLLSPRIQKELEFDFYFAQDANGKFLESLNDDEIAELAAIAEGEVVPHMPAHKEILIEASERRGEVLGY